MSELNPAAERTNLHISSNEYFIVNISLRTLEGITKSSSESKSSISGCDCWPEIVPLNLHFRRRYSGRGGAYAHANERNERSVLVEGGMINSREPVEDMQMYQ